MSSRKQTSGLIFSLTLLAVVAFGWLQRNAIYDWFRLRSYQPDSQVTQLATDTTMTSYAKHLFYVNRPVIEDKSSFNQNCPNNGGEQTIILGCYHSHETGIFLYSVTDPKLTGVEQVTAAHEDLHAIYERLSTKDRNYVNGLLRDYYQHDLKDQRLLDTISAYKKSEPNDVINEMHSVFGTEIANLPPALEAYYQKYFTNRQQIVKYAQQYQSTFTNNQTRATQLLNQIKSLEQQINDLKTQIDRSEANLNAQSQSLESQRPNVTNVQAFNSQVDAYNAAVQKYKKQIVTYNQLIDQHNQLVTEYQAITVENSQLIQELNSRSPTVSTQ